MQAALGKGRGAPQAAEAITGMKRGYLSSANETPTTSSRPAGGVNDTNEGMTSLYAPNRGSECSPIGAIAASTRREAGGRVAGYSASGPSSIERTASPMLPPRSATSRTGDSMGCAQGDRAPA
jgi:hypothetical protein